MPSRHERPRGRAAGASEDDAKAASIADAATHEAQVLALAAASDWRERIEVLRLPARESRELRIAVLCASNFNAARVTRAGRQR